MLEIKDGSLRLYGEIGGFMEGGISSNEFASVLDSIQPSDNITIYLQSNGGDVWEGNAIYSQLKRHAGTVTIVVDSIAASIASVIAMAADNLVMMPHSFLMVHNPWTAMIGDANALRGTADLLDLIGAEIASIYAERSNQPVEKFIDWMASEEWFDTDQAIEIGLADEIYSQKPSIINARETCKPVAMSCWFPKRIAAKRNLRRARLR